MLWYDSVTKDGALRWQDALTPMNEMYFHAADGIFTNYTWNENRAMASFVHRRAARAHPRRVCRD